MAVYRGGVAFWVWCGRSSGCRQPIKQKCWSLNQALDLQLSEPTRTISSFSWALAPPSCLRHQTVGQSTFDLSLSPANRHPGKPIRSLGLEEEWEETVSLCVVVGHGEWEGQRTLVEVPVFGHSLLRELVASESARPDMFLFPFTTVDGSREDDINVRGGGRRGEDERGGDLEPTERESFRSLFEAECCPAPFAWGSQFYCFHGLPRELAPRCGDQSRLAIGLEMRAPVVRFDYSETRGGEDRENDREREREEKLALLYEKLRIELPSFFVKDHDYTLYHTDLEFINGLLNTKTRGRTLYRLTVTLWQQLCRLCLADVQLEVLKLTKHSEDGTVRARWRVRGQPYHLMPLRFYRRDKTPLYRTYDAFSTFYLGPDGLVHCHRVEKVMQAQPPVLPRVTSLLAGALVALGLQEHRPALNLLPFLLSSLRPGRH